jgi:ribosomal protein L22
MCCGGSGGSKSGGGGGASLPDNQQPGEVFREANKANEEQLISNIRSGKITKDQLNVAATSEASRAVQLKREQESLFAKSGKSYMQTKKSPEWQALEVKRKEADSNASKIHRAIRNA